MTTTENVDTDMQYRTDDVRILEISELVSPGELLDEFPVTEAAARTTFEARQAIHRILHGADDRMVAIIGPCSIHDTTAAREYAMRLKEVRDRLNKDLLIIMRVYFEKPRTTVGWKGLINDPCLNGSFQINEGLRIARELLLDINQSGMPVGCEFLDMITPQYIADLVSWGAIGARTTESQVHRELASGLSCPMGFKNGTDGNVRIAVDAVRAASQPHHFLAVTKQGRSAIAATTGNADCHVILRGGRTPNFDAPSVDAAGREMAAAGVRTRMMIDASHGNSGKRPEQQPAVIEAIAAQIEAGDRRIGGVMIESNLVGGRQELAPGRALVYGQSITDGCLEWPASVRVLERLAEAVERRRASRRESRTVTLAD
jgi:3-deoxy-7-phosphoheptulonate synthase